MAVGSFRLPLRKCEDPDPATFCPAEGYILPEDCPVPDPEIYCPANGYIPDEPAASSWIHVLTFYTNSPNTTTFDPSVAAVEGDEYFAWLVGGNVYNTRALSLTLDGTLQKVELWVKDTLTGINGVDFRSDHIVGVVDLTHPIFNTLTNARMNYNAELTGVYFPQDHNAQMNDIWLYNCDLQGVLDLSMFDKLANNMQISLHYNPNLHGVVFAPSITTGYLQYLNLYNCDILGTIDLSMFDTLRNDTTGSDIKLNNNEHLTGIKFASTVTGRLRNLWIYNCDLRYDVDLSMFKDWALNANIQIYDNPNMKTLTFASTLTTPGTLATFYCYLNTSLLSLDISMFTGWTTSATLNVRNNTSMTTLSLPTITTGAIKSLYICVTGISGTLDISGIVHTTGCSMYLNSNSSVTAYNLGSSKVGSFNYLRGYNTAPFFDLTAWNEPITTSTTEADFKNNGWSWEQVDQFLADADSLTSGTGYKCKIYLTGNSIPSAAGLASKANLEAKGMTVYVDS